MENIDITPIIEAVIALVGIVITSFLIPYLKTKMTANQFAYLEEVVKTAVRGAEVIFGGTARGDEKRDYVISHVEKVCAEKHITFDTDEIRQMLETAWLELTQGVAKNEDIKEEI